MSEILNEQLSALVDDELSAAEQHLFLARLSKDADLRVCLSRYQLVKDVLANRIAMSPDVSFSQRVMQALEEELPYHQVPPVRRHWLRPMAGVAVAASVALVAVLSVQSVSQQSTEQPQLAATPVGPSTATVLASQATIPQEATSLPITDEGQVQLGQWNRQAPQVRDRLNGYLVQHNEYAASSGVQGMLPYVRIVGYDNGNND